MKKWEMPEVMELEINNTEYHGHGGGHGHGNGHDNGWGCPDFKPSRPGFGPGFGCES